MAITGTGTQADPFIVHDYNELKTAAKQISNSFIELANDINCNDYGELFEWETVGCGGHSQRFEIDLKGHTIKNAKIKSNNAMFATSRDTSNSIIKNGKLLNIYLGGSKGFCNSVADTGDVTGLRIENISASFNLSGRITFTCAVACEIVNCAIYIEGNDISSNANTPSMFLSYNQSSYSQVIENSDFELNAENAKMVVFAGSQVATRLIKNCRVRGKCNFADSYNLKYLLFNGRACMQDCVINLSSTNMQLEGYGYSQGTVANSDLLPSTAFNSSNIIQVTSEEIVNGDALRAKGFNVVNVLA